MDLPAVVTWYRCVRPHRAREHRPTTAAVTAIDVEPAARTVLAGGRHAANELQHLGDTAPVQAGDDLRLVQACGQQRFALDNPLAARVLPLVVPEFEVFCPSVCEPVPTKQQYDLGESTRRRAPPAVEASPTVVRGSDYHALDDVFARALALALAREHVLRERPEGRAQLSGRERRGHSRHPSAAWPL